MEFKESEDDVCPTPDTYKALSVTCYGVLAIYMITCIPLAHNIVKYLIRQKRYKSFLVSTFYFHAVAHIAFRVLSLAL